jgi:hypothetical protein
MLTAMTTTLDANTTLAAQEKAADLALIKSHLDTMVTTAHSSGTGFGPMAGGMGGMRAGSPFQGSPANRTTGGDSEACWSSTMSPYPHRPVQ